MKYVLLLLPIMASCATPPPKSGAGAAPATSAPVAADAVALTAYHWQLGEAADRNGKRIDALFARSHLPLQLDFRDGRFAVANACNRLGGGYRVENGRLRLGPMAQTLMACRDPALAKLDEAVSQRLQGNPRFDVQGGNGEPRLLLTTDAGDTLDFVGRPTAETRYGSAGETVFLEVDAQTQPCSHPLIPDKRCLKVRERHYDEKGLSAGAPGEWRLFFENIEGYAHSPGVRNVLRIKRYTLKNPPADASSLAYVLDMVVESETMKP